MKSKNYEKEIEELKELINSCQSSCEHDGDANLYFTCKRKAKELKDEIEKGCGEILMSVHNGFNCPRTDWICDEITLCSDCQNKIEKLNKMEELECR